ncbi:hypothetical protein [Peribacillus asahii]|uniref:hypothetical protein n=1 Tax=Peribacillus asahii TaxID=228899 RepID=UPI0037FB8002
MEIILLDGESFALKGISDISDEFYSACEQLANQLKEESAIDHLTFKHADYGEDITVYLRRYDGQFLVSLEGKHFSIED